ncbi:acyl-CoA dehydrogenase family protein [Variovorax sp. E3]|uniref:acyl-CoA dehydrogenase family protein n=1 Tax=Variovorax sp. E3 TaxID=1914993 RepID=UPI0018DC6247|nr:acyl-CoA dehydrogenase family protein [Variovorax sp. E3]
MNDSIIEDSIVRFFSKAFDTLDCINAEKTGQLPTQWDQASENGFANLLSPESNGGAGISWSEAMPLFWGLGYYRVPLPLAETVIANFLINSAGHEVKTSRPIALADEVMAAGLRVVDSASTVVASGTLTHVHWARAADKLLVGLPDGRMGVWNLKSPGCSVVERVDVTKLPSDTVVLESARAELVFDDPLSSVALPVRHLGALARSAMIVGAAEFALEDSVQYALDRVQFGRPIGRNQAIQQQLAQMAGQVAVARHATSLAFQHASSWSSPEQDGDALSAGCAKVLAGEAADIAATVAHQVHGAIGFTYEHVLNFATRRLWAWREDHGTSSWWSHRIGSQVASAGAEDFWPAMTRPSLYVGLGGTSS